ncbi:hypothetical protein M513_05919 [Trichuris suis]|uniref:Uncharacterized protein n=1 Tax=Trichuris suis TaxID=68888 RepID=A0A085M7L3_9BILA|nr:hypothetical protein M513_05919 [Trichuris suis]
MNPQSGISWVGGHSRFSTPLRSRDSRNPESRNFDHSKIPRTKSRTVKGLLLIKGEDRTIRVHFEISKSRSLKKTHKGKCIASKLSTIRQIACLQTLKQIWLSTERKIGQHVTPTHLPCPLKHI